MPLEAPVIKMFLGIGVMGIAGRAQRGPARDEPRAALPARPIGLKNRTFCAILVPAITIIKTLFLLSL
jgi:hypothetical protein